MKLTRLVCNLLPKGCRFDTLEGKQYLVAPMVILTEGVHTGSMGPLYYPPEELSKTPAAWNHKPIVVYHPTMNGQSVSACDPTILNSRKVGVMLNTKFEKGKLKSEAWIDKDRANEVDERILAAIDSKTVMELSTGVFIDVEDEDGKWKEEDYVGIARNYRPDHLALLPDQIGACSVADGAGLLQNRALADNAMSYSNIQNALQLELRKKFNAGPDGPFVWVADVYDSFAVYEKDGKLWRIGYTANDAGVTLSKDAPTEVKRVTEYRTADGAFVGNEGQSTNQTQTMNKTKLVAALIAANVGFLETDKDALSELNEAQLESLTKLHADMPAINFAIERKDGKVQFVVKNAPAAPAPAPAPAANAQPAPAATPAPAPAAAAPAATDKVVSLQEYINQAPVQMREVLNNSLSIYNEEKTRLVEAILANKNNAFTKEDLNARPLGELKNIARLAQAEPTEPTTATANYRGQGNVPASNVAVEEPLEMPALNFAKRN